MLRQRLRGFENLLTGSVGRLCRGALSSGAFWHYLSGYAAVGTAGEEIAAAHADGRPHRDSMRIDKIAQFRSQKKISEYTRKPGNRSSISQVASRIISA